MRYGWDLKKKTIIKTKTKSIKKVMKTTQGAGKMLRTFSEENDCKKRHY